MLTTTYGITHEIADRGAHAAALYGAKRSSHWESCKAAFEKIHPRECAYCGSKEHVQLHHKMPFHLHPELELDPSNLIWLCEAAGGVDHHLHIGHFGNWHQYNPHVEEDCRENREKMKHGRNTH